MSGSPRKRGRPPRVDRAQIARAVVDVGFPSLTFSAVRKHLGVGETTVYRHAADREDLVRLGLDLIIESTVWPSLEDPWRTVLRNYAFAAWHAFESHPGAAAEVSRGVVPFAILRLMEDLCTVLLRGGFSAENAVLACDIVFDLVADNRRGVEHFDASGENEESPRENLEATWSAVSAPRGSATDSERAEVQRAIHASIVADPLVWFTGKLDVVLEGVDRALAPGPH